jgi:hypothetical protein
MILSPLSRPKGATWHKGTVRITHGVHGIRRMINQRQIGIGNRAKAHAAGYSL